MPLTERQQMALLKKEQEAQSMIANVHRRNANGETPLHVAAIKGKSELCERLIAMGARVNVKDHAGFV